MAIWREFLLGLICFVTVNQSALLPNSRRIFLNKPEINKKFDESAIIAQSSTKSSFNPSQSSIKQCLNHLNSNQQSGLTSTEVKNRLQIFGFNELPNNQKVSLFTLFKEQFSDRLSQILLSIVAISTLSSIFEVPFSLRSLTEPFILLLILLLNAATGISQSRSAENSLASLNKYLPKYTSVLRNGEWSLLPASQLVPGDIILLRAGDHVPADSRLLEIKTISFSTDESLLTGENIPVHKGVEALSAGVNSLSNSGISDQSNMIFSGSTVTEGSALAIVIQTGIQTQIGQINSDVQLAKSQPSKTPLTESLDRFTHQLTNIVGMICLSLWTSNIPRFQSFGSWFKGALHYAKNAIALGVAAVPEGLSPAITLCLSLGTHRMAKKGIIVRKLSSIETLGCTSVICTDKTGTLTTNQMCVTSLLTFNQTSEQQNQQRRDLKINERQVEGNSYSPIGSIENSQDIHSSPVFEDISKICSLCNNAELSYSSENGYSRVGEPTEAALKVLVEKVGRSSLSHEKDNYQLNQFGKRWKSLYRILAPLEFTRERKSMSVLCSSLLNTNNHNNTTNTLFTKGAAELLINRCKYLKLEDGQIIPLTNQIKQQIHQKITELSEKSLRLIALAYKTNSNDSLLSSQLNEQRIKSIQNISEYEQIESDLILTGICGIEDPLRDEIKESIERCRDAGIRIMMITGDSKDTALSIGYQSGILSSKDSITESVMSGKEFRELSIENQKNYLRKGNKIFYRTEPKDKQLLIQLLKELNEVTAMTGDGVNDASALSTADIGIAMGITGTEVTKNSADMILSNDSFSSIVSAVEEGRTIYSNLQSMMNYLISCNLGEIGIVVLASLLRIPEILSPLHLLWANLVTDGPPATSLSLNPSEKESMKRLPRKRNESIISKDMIGKYAATSIYETLATVGSFLWWFNDRKVSLKDLRCIASRSVECNQILSSLSSFSLSQPQSMALSVLLVIEMLKALSSISRDQSLITVPPWKNKWLIFTVLSSISIHLTFMYTPFLSGLLKISPLSLREWRTVMLFSLPILGIEEMFKFIQRFKQRSRRIES